MKPNHSSSSKILQLGTNMTARLTARSNVNEPVIAEHPANGNNLTYTKWLLILNMLEELWSVMAGISLGFTLSVLIFKGKDNCF